MATMLRVPGTVFLFSTFLCIALHAQKTVLPLWPSGAPEMPQTTGAEKDITSPADGLISGHRTARLTNISQPTLTVFPPTAPNTGVAALVFPGGAYQVLAWDGEGVDACKWLNSIGAACLLVKYRVPQAARYPASYAAFEDAQQAMRLARAHAAEWHIHPAQIGVMGFSAGGHLAVALSTHWNDEHVLSTPAASDVHDTISAKPAFTILVYPAYLESPENRTQVEPELRPGAAAPPTFLVQAENDSDYVDSALAYFIALKAANVPAELHLYATGGHGFGVYPTEGPAKNWTALAAAWLERVTVSH